MYDDFIDDNTYNNDYYQDVMAGISLCPNCNQPIEAYAGIGECPYCKRLKKKKNKTDESRKDTL
jgi:hypothetical protein